MYMDPAIQAQCCPSKDSNVIPEDADTKPARDKLLCLYYTFMIYLIFKGVVFGVLALIFGLLFLMFQWQGYARMDACQNMINGLIWLMEAIQMTAAAAAVSHPLLIIVAIYLWIGTIFTYQAYAAFGKKAQELRGGDFQQQSNGLPMWGQPQPQEAPRTTMYQTTANSQTHNPAPARSNSMFGSRGNSGGHSAFQGSGTRLG